MLDRYTSESGLNFCWQRSLSRDVEENCIFDLVDHRVLPFTVLLVRYVWVIARSVLFESLHGFPIPAATYGPIPELLWELLALHCAIPYKITQGFSGSGQRALWRGL